MLCIISFHPYHYLCILVSYFVLMHIGSPEGVTLLDFEEEVEDNQGTAQTVAPKGKEPATNDLLECPDH